MSGKRIGIVAVAMVAAAAGLWLIGPARSETPVKDVGVGSYSYTVLVDPNGFRIFPATLAGSVSPAPAAVGTWTTDTGGRATTSDSNITLFTVPAATTYYHLYVLNGSGVAGWVSWDSGVTWVPWLTNQQTLPGGSIRVTLSAGTQVMFKRLASGTNVTGLVGGGT
jgi:hypothetical protein